MNTFRERLQLAAAHAGVEFSQTALARAFGISKQTVDRWFQGFEPRAPMLFHIADSLGVDARWLATAEGSMLQPPSRRVAAKAGIVGLALALSSIGSPPADAAQMHAQFNNNTDCRRWLLTAINFLTRWLQRSDFWQSMQATA